MSYWLLNNIIWTGIITIWVLAKRSKSYPLLIGFIKKKAGYVERKEKIRISWLESKIRFYAQDIKRRSPHDLNLVEKIFAPLLNLKRYTGTIANLISFSRILLAIIVVLLLIIYYLTGEMPAILLTALFCFIISGVSDFFDGATARALEEISSLGKKLDPFADKVLLSAPFFILGAIYLPANTYWSIIRQETFLMIIFLLKLVAEKLPFSMASQANSWGKTKTTFELIAAGFLFICPLNPVFVSVANFLFLISIPLAIGSIVGYISSVRYLRNI